MIKVAGHPCEIDHDTYADVAQCLFPSATSVDGEGQFAVIWAMDEQVHLTLFADLHTARRQLRFVADHLAAQLVHLTEAEA